MHVRIRIESVPGAGCQDLRNAGYPLLDKGILFQDRRVVENKSIPQAVQVEHECQQSHRNAGSDGLRFQNPANRQNCIFSRYRDVLWSVISCLCGEFSPCKVNSFHRARGSDRRRAYLKGFSHRPRYRVSSRLPEFCHPNTAKLPESPLQSAAMPLKFSKFLRKIPKMTCLMPIDEI